MRKYWLIILLLLLSGWKWDSHSYFVDSVYYSLPFEVRSRLNLSEMEYGSIVPDKVFRDNVLHHYPSSYEKAKNWIKIAKEEYDSRYYENASYAFGIASHYITDSFVAPHYIKGEDYKDHDLFETLAIKDLKSECRGGSYNLNESLYKASLNSKEWKNWLENKNEKIPIKESEQSLQFLYLVALDVFNTTCYNNKTGFEIVKFFIPDNAWIFLFIILGAYFIYLIWKKV